MYMLVTYGYYVMVVLGFLISVGFYSCVVTLHSFAWSMPFNFWMFLWVCIRSILIFKLAVIRWVDRMGWVMGLDWNGRFLVRITLNEPGWVTFKHFFHSIISLLFNALIMFEKNVSANLIYNCEYTTEDCMINHRLWKCQFRRTHFLTGHFSHYEIHMT